MEQFNITIAIAAATVVGLGLTSGVLQKLPFSRPLAALLIGIAMGPAGIALLHPEDWGTPHVILKEAARITLAISVMGVALRVPLDSLRVCLRPLLLLLGPGLLLMWAVSAGLSWLILGLAPLMALALGAIITPTDPVVAASIVTGHMAEEKLPLKTRTLLSAESGANDGLAYLLVMLPLLILTDGAAEGWQGLLTHTLPVGVILAVLIGGLLGGAVGFALRLGDRRGWVSHSSILGMTVALSLLAVAGARAIGSDGILAAFAAGLAFNAAVDRKAEMEDENVQEAIVKLFTLPVFVLMGTMLPWSEWAMRSWPFVLFCLAAVALRRPLTVLILAPFLGLPRRDDLFIGWFGPIGVAALYYALHAKEMLHDPELWVLASGVVTMSVLAHGITSGPGVQLYSKAAPSKGD